MGIVYDLYTRKTNEASVVGAASHARLEYASGQLDVGRIAKI